MLLPCKCIQLSLRDSEFSMLSPSPPPPLPPHSSTETSSSVDASVVEELQKALESTQRELRDMKDRKESFERECVIYQSQLEVYTWCVCGGGGGSSLVPSPPPQLLAHTVMILSREEGRGVLLW